MKQGMRVKPKQAFGFWKGSLESTHSIYVTYVSNNGYGRVLNREKLDKITSLQKGEKGRSKASISIGIDIYLSVQLKIPTITLSYSCEIAYKNLSLISTNLPSFFFSPPTVIYFKA